MAKSFKLDAKKRSLTGKKTAQLRRSGKIPAIIYGREQSPISIEVETVTFNKIYTAAGATNIIALTLDSETKAHNVIISDVAVDPVTDKIIHVDFRQVLLTEKIKAQIPLVLIGESPAVKEFNAVVSLTLQEIEVEALPQDLPDSISIDISILKELDQSILLSDIKLNLSQVTPTLSPDTTLVTCQAQKVEVEAPADTTASSTEAQTPSSTPSPETNTSKS